MVALVFTSASLFDHCGGCKVRPRSKDEALPHPIGSILSGGTVVLRMSVLQRVHRQSIHAITTVWFI